MNIVIPIAGRGSRFLQESHRNPDYANPKPLINIAGHSMIEWALSSYPLTKEDKLIFIVRKDHLENAQIDEKLKQIFGENIYIVVVDKITEGAACTALLAKDYINNDEPLLITDSDHYIDGHAHFKVIENHEKVDGAIPVFYANNAKWSFAKTDEEGYVTETAEKVQISRNANIGAYYFAKGRDFVWAAEEMIEEDDKTNGEFYVAPVYNYLIRRGKSILLSRPKFVHGLGTPKDVDKFLEFLKRGEIRHRFANIKI
ncbi:glycosyl transferase family 2 [Candidatus Pacearchaeota archaeon]|nr:glycosyl transferase family 2 [Candidatus Pacearchaeota archaeon]|tara:strand:+ start:3080 stop:3850 length:771 start_codon:yes stop_codon:yes gene_type:complete